MSAYASLLVCGLLHAQAPSAQPGPAPQPAPQAQPQPQQAPVIQPTPQIVPVPMPAPQAAPPPAAPAPPPAQAAPVKDTPPDPNTTRPGEAAAPKGPAVPWKLITKIGSGVAYGVWVLLWTVMLPAYLGGLVLLGLSTSPAVADSSAGMVLGGAVLMGVGTVLLLLGAVAVSAGAGLGITTTVLQQLNPDNEAADNIVSAFIPRTLML